MTTPKEAKLIPVEEIEAYLREKYPKCFNDDYLPLKIDFHKNIRRTNPPFTRDKLGPGLKNYVRNEKYLEKITQAGHPRYDLEGKVCGEVTEAQAKNMIALLEKVKRVGGWEIYDTKRKEKLKARKKLRKEAKRKQKELEAQQTIKAQPEPVKEVEKTVKPKKTVETKDEALQKTAKPKKKAVKAEAPRPVEPVVKTKKEVKISLGERRTRKSVLTEGKKKLSLKKI